MSAGAGDWKRRNSERPVMGFIPSLSTLSARKNLISREISLLIHKNLQKMNLLRLNENLTSPKK
mgnify:CR=1 FL=1